MTVPLIARIQRRSREIVSRAEFLLAMERAGEADHEAVSAALDVLVAEEELLLWFAREIAAVQILDSANIRVLP